MSHFVDVHNHLLYKMDDGAENPRETARMLLAAEKDGIRRMVATSHVHPGRGSFNYASYLDTLRLVNEFCVTK